MDTDDFLPLILVSQSPRRINFLKKWGFIFSSMPVQIKETLNPKLNLEDAIQDIAQQKIQALINSHKLKAFQKFLLLSADTLVVLDGCVLGKPKDKKEAIDFLQRLSHKVHTVKTGLCLQDHSGHFVTGIETTKVHFKALNLADILSYVETGDPLDKSGAYGVQSVKDHFISHIKGRVDNMMGLPQNLFERLLKENAWHVERIDKIQ